jgi:hypothetical protein
MPANGPFSAIWPSCCAACRSWSATSARSERCCRIAALAGIVLAATAAAEETQDPITERLAEVIAQHGWPCGGIAGHEPLADDLFSVTCADGQRYEVFVRPGWTDTGAPRQTHLRPLLEVGVAVRGLEAAEPAARREAALSLARLGPEATAAASHLTRAMTGDRDPSVRAAAATALGRLGLKDEAILAALGRATTDPSPEVRTEAATALALLGG